MPVRFALPYDLFTLNFTITMNALRNYVQIMEEGLMIATNVQCHRLSETLKETPVKDESEYREKETEIHDKQEWLTYTFPRSQQTFRYSVLVYLCAILETGLIAFCDELKARRKVSRGVDEYGNQKTGWIDFGSIERWLKDSFRLPANWEQVKQMRLIRNCIVHAAGYVEGYREERALREMIEQNRIPGYSLTKDDIISRKEMIKLESEFGLWSIDQVKTLFYELFDAGFGPLPKIRLHKE